MSGAKLSRLEVSSGGDKKILVMKTVSGQEKEAQSKSLGLPREAIFYRELASALGNVVPTVAYSCADEETGEKCVIMEDLSRGVQAGYFFGPGNPNNWKKDLDALTAPFGDRRPTAAEITAQSFHAMAVTHATYWRKEEILGHRWLRGSQWLRGDGFESWKEAQDMVTSMWAKVRGDGSSDTAAGYSPVITKAVDAAIAAISWDSYRKRLNPDSQWTLVHGDFHPANMICLPEASRPVVMVDWEMVGVGSGPQDLGQYVISHMTPEDRRPCERALVEGYYKELLDLGVDGKAFTWEECWQEYRVGGLERWLWFLAYFAGMGEGMVPVAKFFHDQVLAFVKDHEIKFSELGQPRP
eukprot:TRINITY_DN7727_c0_g1_i1.p1 TRINITY_DN7727_c0_g1~~TRINITY_DN7727_c0_g1_i1.p1  ORF type:complete len:354 (+),score=117.11 TRINITY_DN7727_c0_g1_i1:243-1304(+)